MRSLFLTSPMMSGPDIGKLQSILNQLGYPCGPVDNLYGTSCVYGVKLFQKANSLEVDGIAGPKTLALLYSLPLPNFPSPIVATPSNVGRLALKEAEQHVGVTEDPPGSNNTMFGTWYGFNRVAWCAEFISYCFKVGADYELCSGFKGAGVKPGKGCSFVPTVEAWLKIMDLWVGLSTPLPGDIAIYHPKTDPNHADHIGIVESTLSGDKFRAIEGNYSSAVKRVNRTLDETIGFGRIK